jgi:hypothetical protein
MTSFRSSTATRSADEMVTINLPNWLKKRIPNDSVGSREFVRKADLFFKAIFFYLMAPLQYASAYLVNLLGDPSLLFNNPGKALKKAWDNSEGIRTFLLVGMLAATLTFWGGGKLTRIWAERRLNHLEKNFPGEQKVEDFRNNMQGIESAITKTADITIWLGLTPFLLAWVLNRNDNKESEGAVE